MKKNCASRWLFTNYTDMYGQQNIIKEVAACFEQPSALPGTVIITQNNLTLSDMTKIES